MRLFLFALAISVEASAAECVIYEPSKPLKNVYYDGQRIYIPVDQLTSQPTGWYKGIPTTRLATLGGHMLTVKISKSAVQKVSKTGTKYFVQTGVIQLFDREGELEECPRKIEFMCDASYPVGEYDLSPASFGVGQYDKLEIRRLVLSPKVGTGAKPLPPLK